MSFFTKTAKATYGTAKRLPALAVTSAVGWLGYSALKTRDAPGLPAPFASDLRKINSLAAGEIALHESRTRNNQRQQASALLVHGVNAAASSYEMRPLFQRIETQRHAVAMDLPGFGHSERDDRDYTPELMADAIASVLDDLGSPTHIVALSLGSELAARAALIRPDLVRSLTFISPTGMGSRTRIEAREPGWFDHAIDNSLIGQGLFDLLVTTLSLDYFLSKSFAGEVDAGLRMFAKMSGEQPGARFAPIAFLKGGLFTPNALRELYLPLATPTLVLYDKDAYTDFANLPEFVSRGGKNRKAERIATTMGLPQFDKPDDTVDAISRFWGDVERS